MSRAAGSRGPGVLTDTSQYRGAQNSEGQAPRWGGPVFSDTEVWTPPPSIYRVAEELVAGDVGWG